MKGLRHQPAPRSIWFRELRFRCLPWLVFGGLVAVVAHLWQYVSPEPLGPTKPTLMPRTVPAQVMPGELPKPADKNIVTSTNGQFTIYSQEIEASFPSGSPEKVVSKGFAISWVIPGRKSE